MLRPVSFGPFTLDQERRQLLVGEDAQPVHLSPKAYGLLSVLADARPRAVAKSELHQQLWPSTFVSEATLASLVAELRVALGGEDLVSKNGTHLRGQAVTSPSTLDDGDQIRIGAFELTFRRVAGQGSTETWGNARGRRPIGTYEIVAPRCRRHG